MARAVLAVVGDRTARDAARTALMSGAACERARRVLAVVAGEARGVPAKPGAGLELADRGRGYGFSLVPAGGWAVAAALAATA